MTTKKAIIELRETYDYEEGNNRTEGDMTTKKATPGRGQYNTRERIVTQA